MKYITNPKIRCVKCGGRLVSTIEGDKITNNLEPNPDGHFVCINTQECEQNIGAESSIVEFSIEEGKVKPFRWGNADMSVEVKK